MSIPFLQDQCDHLDFRKRLLTNHLKSGLDFLENRLNDNAHSSSSGARNVRWKETLHLALYLMILLVDMVMSTIAVKLRKPTSIETSGEKEVIQTVDGMKITTEVVARDNGEAGYFELCMVNLRLHLLGSELALSEPFAFAFKLFLFRTNEGTWISTTIQNTDGDK